jgi:type IV secretion system protein VirB9
MTIVRFCFLILILLNSLVVKAGGLPRAPIPRTESYIDDLDITTDNKIKTYIYNPNEVYLLVLHFGFHSSIEFAKNEEVKTIVLGDSYAWDIRPVLNRLFVRPLEKNIRTNMTIVTNKRTYEFDIAAMEPEEGHEKDLVYVIRFYYPKKRRGA